MITALRATETQGTPFRAAGPVGHFIVRDYTTPLRLEVLWNDTAGDWVDLGYRLNNGGGHSFDAQTEWHYRLVTDTAGAAVAFWDNSISLGRRG